MVEHKQQEREWNRKRSHNKKEGKQNPGSKKERRRRRRRRANENFDVEEKKIRKQRFLFAVGKVEKRN